MSTQVTLTLPDELYEYAQTWSMITHSELSETLSDALKIVLTPLHQVSKTEKPIAQLPNDEVMALTTRQMNPQQGEKLNKLLEKQRESELDADEQVLLATMMQLYNQMWIRQSEALTEAVRRGLRKPLEQ